MTGPAPFAQRAFTLLEMLVAITILAMVVSMVAPMFSDDDRLHLMSAAGVVASDVELAQVMTISYPDEPVVVRFDPANQSYWLAYAADPDTPIARADTGAPYLVVMGQGRASSAQGVAFELNQVNANTLEFDAHGGLVDFTASPAIELNCGAQAITLSIAPLTGTVTETDGPIPAEAEEEAMEIEPIQ